jgi:hypothetical protein
MSCRHILAHFELCLLHKALFQFHVKFDSDIYSTVVSVHDSILILGSDISMITDSTIVLP